MSTTGSQNSFAPSACAFVLTLDGVAGTIAANNGKVLFESQTFTTNPNFLSLSSPGNITVLTGAAGKYILQWYVSGAEVNAFAVYINDVLQARTTYDTQTTDVQNHGQCTLLLADGDVVSLRTVACATPITLQAAASEMIVASMIFQRFQ